MNSIFVYVTDLRALILEGLMLMNLLIGTYVGIMKDGFDPAKFASWFDKDVLKIGVPYVLTLAAALQGLPIALETSRSTADYTAWLLLVPPVVTVGHSIYSNLKKLLHKPPPKPLEPVVPSPPVRDTEAARTYFKSIGAKVV